MKAKYLILCRPNSNPDPKKYLGCEYKGSVFCRNNDFIMENMDKGLTVPKWVLISLAENMPKCLKIFHPKISVQAQKFEIFEKSSFWVSIVRGFKQPT